MRYELADQIDLIPNDVWASDCDIVRNNPLDKVPALIGPDGIFIGSLLCCELSRHPACRQAADPNPLLGALTSEHHHCMHLKAVNVLWDAKCSPCRWNNGFLTVRGTVRNPGVRHRLGTIQ